MLVTHAGAPLRVVIPYLTGQVSVSFIAILEQRFNYSVNTPHTRFKKGNTRRYI